MCSAVLCMAVVQCHVSGLCRAVVKCAVALAVVQCHVSGLCRAVVKCAVALGGWAAAATGWGIAPPLLVVATRWPHGWLEAGPPRGGGTAD